jgi:hypothetical protein
MGDATTQRNLFLEHFSTFVCWSVDIDHIKIIDKAPLVLGTAGDLLYPVLLSTGRFKFRGNFEGTSRIGLEFRSVQHVFRNCKLALRPYFRADWGFVK